MNSINQIKKTDKKLIQTIESLSKEIWHEHYDKLVGAAQVDYMLEKFLSLESVVAQIKEGYEYYLICFEETPVGYISIHNRKDHLFLSKFYMQKLMRGKGFGRKALDFVKEKANNWNLNKIELTVHKQNPTLDVYKALGFEIKEPIVTDIGNGYVMDDYTMELTL